MVCTVFYTPLFLEHKTKPEHPESHRRLSLALEELRRSGVCPSELCEFRRPRREVRRKSLEYTLKITWSLLEAYASVVGGIST